MADRILGAVCLVLAAAMAYFARSYAAEISYEPVGPRAFPLLLAAIFALIGAWLVVTGGRKVATATATATAPRAVTLARPLPIAGDAEAATAMESAAPAPPENQLVAVAMCAIAVLVYAALFQTLGFVLATTLMTVPVCKAFGGTVKAGLIGGLGLGLGLYLLFDKVLDVILPTGVLSFILGGR